MTFAEIQEAIGKDASLLSQFFTSYRTQAIEALKAGDLVVRTKDEDTAFVNRSIEATVNQRVEKQVKEKADAEYGRVMGNIDAQIRELSGLERNQDEKTTDYAKRALLSLKDKPDQTSKDRIAILEKEIREAKEAHKVEVEKLTTENFNAQISASIDAELDKRAFQIPVNIKDEKDKAAFIAQEKEIIKQHFLNSYKATKDKDGQVIFSKGEQAQLSTGDAKPLTAGDLITSNYGARFMPGGARQEGGGSNPGGERGEVKPGSMTRDEAHKYASETLKLDPTTRTYLDKVVELSVAPAAAK